MAILPIIAGLLLPFLKLDKIKRNIYVVAFAVATSIIAFSTIINNYDIELTIILDFATCHA